jgi:hypothetical protein
MSRSRSKRMDFARQFEGAQVLDGLLQLAGASHDTLTVLAHMRQAHAEGRASQEVIPSLFEHEPRFESPDLARRLFQNLLGLWDLVQEGKSVRLEDGPRPSPHTRTRRCSRRSRTRSTPSHPRSWRRSAPW